MNLKKENAHKLLFVLDQKLKSIPGIESANDLCIFVPSKTTRKMFTKMDFSLKLLKLPKVTKSCNMYVILRPISN